MNKKITSNIILLFAILGVFLYVFLNLRFCPVYSDDLQDFINYNFEFWHARVTFELLSVLIIKWLPDMFNIHIQNFAPISSGAFRAFLWVSMAYLSISNIKKYNNNPVLFPLLFLFINIVLYAILINNNFAWSFDNSQYFTGYAVAPILWMIFFNVLTQLHVEQENIKKRDIITITLLGLISATGNEEINIATIILLCALLLYKIFLKTKYKSNEKFSYLILPLIAIILLNISLYARETGATIVLTFYDVKINLFQSLETYLKYINLFIKTVIVQNIHFFIPFITALFLLKKNIKEHSKAIEITFFALFSFFLYTLGTIYLPHNAYNTNGEYPFWFLHSGLKTTLDVCILSIIIFFVTYAVVKIEKKKAIFLAILACLSFSLEIKNFENLKEFHIGGIEAKKVLYRTDVITTFYLSKNKTAILPTNTEIKITQNHNFWEIAEDESLQNQIYEKEPNHYLLYIEKEYGLNADAGFTFKPTDEAMALFYAQGGILNEEDVDKLDFNKIKKDLESNK